MKAPGYTNFLLERILFQLQAGPHTREEYIQNIRDLYDASRIDETTPHDGDSGTPPRETVQEEPGGAQHDQKPTPRVRQYVRGWTPSKKA